MTVDLYGPGGPGLGLGWSRCAHSVPNGGSLYIDAGKPDRAQQYNRFDGRFQAVRSLSTIRNFTFDTPNTRPYKRGSHGERGVPKTSRVLATEVFATQMVPLAAVGLDPPVVRSMHRWLGKGYAGGGERQHSCFRFRRR